MQGAGARFECKVIPGAIQTSGVGLMHELQQFSGIQQKCLMGQFAVAVLAVQAGH